MDSTSDGNGQALQVEKTGRIDAWLFLNSAQVVMGTTNARHTPKPCRRYGHDRCKAHAQTMHRNGTAVARHRPSLQAAWAQQMQGILPDPAGGVAQRMQDILPIHAAGLAQQMQSTRPNPVGDMALQMQDTRPNPVGGMAQQMQGIRANPEGGMGTTDARHQPDLCRRYGNNTCRICWQGIYQNPAGGTGTTDTVQCKAHARFPGLHEVWAQQMQANHPRAGDGMGTPNARHWE